MPPRQKGGTLTNLALINELSESACRVALTWRGYFTDQIIADFICVPAETLWPDRYGRDGNPLHPYIRVKPSREWLAGHGQKTAAQ